MRTLLAEIIQLVLFVPLRIVSRLFGRRANARVHQWQDHMWLWVGGAAAVGLMSGSNVADGAHHGAHGLDAGHDSGGHDVGGGFDGGFGGDIGGGFG